MPLKLELTGFVDACPPKITMPCIIFQQVMSTGLTLNMYISTIEMCWFQQTMSSKRQHIHYNSQHIIHDQVFVFKKGFCKNCYIFNKNVWIKNIFRLTQATNTYTHISINIGATMTASRKLTHDKFSNFFTKKAFKKKMHYNQKRL